MSIWDGGKCVHDMRGNDIDVYVYEYEAFSESCDDEPQRLDEWTNHFGKIVNTIKS